MTRSLTAPVILYACAGLFGAGAADARQATGQEVSWPQADVQADWSPPEEARRLVEMLHRATTREDAEAAILEILQRLGVGVYSHAGVPRVAGNESSGEDFFLYDRQVSTVAEAYLQGRYTPLHVLVENWRGWSEAGFTLGPAPGELGHALFDSREVEAMLRAMRRLAEDEPHEPQGLLIRVFDALGDRDRHPFDLLDDEPADASDHPILAAGFGPALRRQLEEELRAAREQAIAAGDAEELELIERLEDDEAREAVLAAGQQQDLGAMMRAMVGPEADEMMDEMRESLDEMRAALLDPDASPEEREMAAASLAMIEALLDGFDGGDPMDFARRAMEAGQQRQEALDAQQRRVEREAEEQAREALDQSRDPAGALLEPAYAYIESQRRVAAQEWITERNRQQQEYLEERVEEGIERNEELRELERRFGPITLDEEAGSALMLDAVQVLLIHLDLLPHRRFGAAGASPIPSGAGDALFGEAAPRATASRSDDRPGASATPNLLAGMGGPDAGPWPSLDAPVYRSGDPCAAIRNTDPNSRDLFGFLKHLTLDARGQLAADPWAGTRWTRSSPPRPSTGSMVVDGATILAGAIETLGTIVHAEAVYEPEDGSEGGIHLRHARRDQRRLGIQATVEMVFDLGRVADCGPLVGIPLAQQGPRANVPVRFYVPADALRLLHARPRDWDLVRGGRYFMKRTDQTGSTTGHFEPIWEEDNVGGQRRTLETEVTVVAMPDPSASVIYSPADWGLAVGSELFKPISTTVPIKIEYHEPTPLRGTVSIRRTVTESGYATGDRPARRGERRSVEERATGFWELDVELDDVEIGGDGGGFGRFEATLNGTRSHSSREEVAVYCVQRSDGSWYGILSPEDGDINRRLSTQMFAEGQIPQHRMTGEGPVSIRVQRSGDTHKLAYSEILLQVAAALGRSRQSPIRSNITVREIDCDGRPREQPRGESTRGLGRLTLDALFSLRPLPQAEWAPLDRDSPRVTGVITDSHSMRSPDGRLTLEVTTQVHWDLHRTQP